MSDISGLNGFSNLTTSVDSSTSNNISYGIATTANTNSQLVWNTNDYTWTTTNGSTWYTTVSGISDNPLKNLSYDITFTLDNKLLLTKNIHGLKKNLLLFNCNYDNNHIQPYEYIMDLIEEKKKFDIKIKISDVLTITYTNVQLKKIVNNLQFNEIGCDFSLLKVKFKFDDVLYENHKLSDKQKRTEKLKKILKNESNNN